MAALFSKKKQQKRIRNKARFENSIRFFFVLLNQRKIFFLRIIIVVVWIRKTFHRIGFFLIEKTDRFEQFSSIHYQQQNTHTQNSQNPKVLSNFFSSVDRIAFHFIQQNENPNNRNNKKQKIFHHQQQYYQSINSLLTDHGLNKLFLFLFALKIHTHTK